MDNPENSLDAFLDEGLKQQEDSKRLFDANANLIHRVFAQTEAGRELMDLWCDGLMMIPTAQPQSTQIEVGINEGMKQFVRNIIVQVKSVENDNE